MNWARCVYRTPREPGTKCWPTAGEAGGRQVRIMLDLLSNNENSGFYSTCVSGELYWSAQAVAIKKNSQGYGLNNRNLVSHSSRCWKFKVRVPAWPLSGEDSLLCLQTATFSQHSHRPFPQFMLAKGKEREQAREHVQVQASSAIFFFPSFENIIDIRYYLSLRNTTWCFDIPISCKRMTKIGVS